ncbi:hypothetical protein D3OALGA1CA_419 [Olavius algarvensis associated proteobacterium Delta 3]|nr:hypothetical protein D3OALGA1CA_419 [Olavius algarvensis associated proteobacterium Delta 3]
MSSKRTRKDRPGTILFRVDGGNVYSIGMGHLYRCIRLATRFKASNVNCHFVVKTHPEAHCVVSQHGFTSLFLKGEPSPQAEIQAVLELASTREALLFVDLRKDKQRLVERSESEGIRCVVYEDVHVESVAPTLLINPAPNAHRVSAYGKSVGQTRFLLGPEYLVLDPELNAHCRTQFSPAISKLFLCFGGADPCNISTRVLGILLDRDDTFHIILALGPAFGHTASIRNLLQQKDIRKRVSVVENCHNLASLQSTCEAAITAGGTLVFESIVICLPTLALPSIDAEARNVSELMERGLVAGFRRDVADVSDAVLRRRIGDFLDDVSMRESLFQSSKKANFSGGTDRVAREVMRLM